MPELWKADEVVAHNGDDFDIRWLRTRALYHGFSFPTHIRSFDTYKQARSLFRLNSNKLDYIAKFLKIPGKSKTSPQLWVDVWWNKSRDALTRMVDYCKNDVLVLKRIYQKIAGYAQPNVHHGMLLLGVKVSCPWCAHGAIKIQRRVATGAGTIKYLSWCLKCGCQFYISDKTKRKAGL